MPRWCKDKLDREYAEWLDEFCICDIEEDGCSCLDFDDWFDEKLEDYAESLDQEENYA